jgi:hypothetical protein
VSVSLVLVPLAVAAVSAWHVSRAEADEEGRLICHVGTRMRDIGLLRAALADTSAAVREEDGALIADWAGVHARFTRDAEGIWSAHLAGDVDEARAVGIVTAVDQAYGRQVQAAVVTRLRDKAPSAGMRVESQTVGEDASVTLVLALDSGEQR